MPVVQASVPALAPADKLVSANSVTTMVNMFASMAGMAIAGGLYDRFGLFPILVASAVCFAITAVMDLLIRIPYKKQESSNSFAGMVKNDLSLSGKFIMKDKPILARCAFIVFLMQIMVIPMLLVGVPVLITQNLGYGMDLVGISSSIMMAGGLIGSIVAGVLGARLSIRKAPLILTAGSLAITPIGLVFLFEVPVFISYIVITAATALCLGIVQMAGILFMAFVQGEVPSKLIGKVMSLLVILPFVANGAGSFMYGLLFEWFESLPWIVVFGTVVASVMVALYAKCQLRNAPIVLPAIE